LYNKDFFGNNAAASMLLWMHCNGLFCLRA